MKVLLIGTTGFIVKNLMKVRFFHNNNLEGLMSILRYLEKHARVKFLRLSSNQEY